MPTLTPTIGLEIHVELKTQTKMFCGCLNDPDERHSNINVCPICMGHPGVLPVINKEAVKKVLRVGMALNGRLAEESHFDRKNYFYPDLPKGYQISQYQQPLVSGGYLKIQSQDNNIGDKNFQFSISNFQTNPNDQNQKSKTIRIRRIHLEEDAARLIHEKDESSVDFNRAGMPLMELVTEPDITSGKDAKAFCGELQLILRYLDVSDADMEKGQMRCEVNISLNMGTKVEIKNLNSFRAVERAIDYEIGRQKGILSAEGPAAASASGGKSDRKIEQETRGWDDAKGKTFSQRKKEEAHDYRYFPEPDLPSLDLRKSDFPQQAREIGFPIPELPSQKRERFKKEYGLKEPQIEILVRDKKLSDFFENTMSELETEAVGRDNRCRGASTTFVTAAELTFNYLTSDLIGLMNEKYLTWEDLKITPHSFGELMAMISKKEISSAAAKSILAKMLETGKDAAVIAKEENLEQISNKGFIEEAVRKAIETNPKAVSDYKKGKEEAIQFLIGQVMRETKGKTNPESLKEILRQSLRG